MVVEFSIVDIPRTSGGGSNSAILDALSDIKNIGKAISIPLVGRNSNSVRKTIRSSAKNRGLLKENKFNTKVDGETLVIWLTKKEPK